MMKRRHVRRGRKSLEIVSGLRRRVFVAPVSEPGSACHAFADSFWRPRTRMPEPRKRHDAVDCSARSYERPRSAGAFRGVGQRWRRATSGVRWRLVERRQRVRPQPASSSASASCSVPIFESKTSLPRQRSRSGVERDPVLVDDRRCSPFDAAASLGFERCEPWGCKQIGLWSGSRTRVRGPVVGSRRSQGMDRR